MKRFPHNPHYLLESIRHATSRDVGLLTIRNGTLETSYLLSMPLSNLIPSFRPTLMVTSLKALIRTIFFLMGLDHTLIEFFSRAATGLASVLMIIFAAGPGVPRRAACVVRRTVR